MNSGGLSFDEIQMWRVDALKDFCRKRNLKVSGKKAELVARVFAASEMGIPIEQTAVERARETQEGKAQLLKTSDGALPDSAMLKNGWLCERKSITSWPPVFLSDITIFLMADHPGRDVNIHERILRFVNWCSLNLWTYPILHCARSGSTELLMLVLSNMAKRAPESAQFCAVPRKSIKLHAESVGISFLSSEAAGALAEDVTYRIREVIQNAISFVKHGKRDHLTGEDINRTLYWSHVEPIYGYGSKNSNIFSSISMRDGDIFFHEDKEVNLRELTFSKGLSSLSELSSGDPKISIESTLLDEETTTKHEPNTDDPANPSTKELSKDFDSLSDVLKLYYHQITRNIINGDTDTVQFVLADLKDNSRVQIFLPYLVHFITTGIKSLSGDSEKLLRLFALIKTLVYNKNLYLEPYVVQFVRAVMYCLIEKGASQTNGEFDEWGLRDAASNCLCYIDRKCSNTTNFLHHQLLRTLKDIYEDHEQPLHSHYGAIIGLSMLGAETVEQTILPCFKTFAEHFDSLEKANSSEMVTEKHYAMDALKRSALSFFRNKLRALAAISPKDNPESQNKSQVTSNEAEISSKLSLSESGKSGKDIVEWYEDLNEFYGESFCLLGGNFDDYKSILPCRIHNPSNGFSGRRVSDQSVGILQARKLIERARESRTHKDSACLSVFSLPAAKRRRLTETEPSTSSRKTYVRIISHFKSKALNSEQWFEHLIEKSTAEYLQRASPDWRSHVGKWRGFTARKTSLLPSLSVSL